MKHYKVDPELARDIELAADSGESVSIAIGKRVYSLHVTSESAETLEDVWVDYDPERILRALAKANGLFSEDEADELIHKVYEGRERGTRPADRP